MALRYTLHIRQGETWELTVPLIPDPPDEAADYSAYTVVGQVRAAPASDTVLYEWSALENNVDVQALAIVLNVPAAVSSEWTWRRGVWDLELTDPATGAAITLAEGWVYVTPEITR